MFSLVGASGIVAHLICLSLLMSRFHWSFAAAQVTASFVAMTENFFLNVAITYRDRKLRRMYMVSGLASFWVACSFGAWANVIFAHSLLMAGDWNPVARLSETGAGEKQFDAEVVQLRRQPGPALCESMLRCYFAGKPYVYDPFNATRLIDFGKLDAGVVVEDLRDHRYGAVQFDGPLDEEIRSERFAGAILDAVRENYMLAAKDDDGEIYVPKSEAAN